ncbi:MAG: GNAT family N-acetyltransferase [Bacteroidota bacterium]
MNIIELTIANNYQYKSFFTQGVVAHQDCFRMSPSDEQYEPFPTRGTADSFTLGVISEKGELMGVVSFQREGATREKLRHKGLLFRMYVAADHGGKGVGRQLVAEVISRARKLTGIEQINLTVIASNDKAKRLYSQFGFETFSVEKNAIKAGEQYYTEEQMVLFLLK